VQTKAAGCEFFQSDGNWSLRDARPNSPQIAEIAIRASGETATAILICRHFLKDKIKHSKSEGNRRWTAFRESTFGLKRTWFLR
jgi:hypothetical protein